MENNVENKEIAGNGHAHSSEDEQRGKPGEKLPEKYLIEPLTMGEIIDRTISIFRDNYKPFLITSGIFQAPFIILLIISIVLVAILGENGNILAMIVMVIAGLIGFALYFLLSGTCIKLTSDIYMGKPTSFKEAILFLLNNILPYVGTIMLTGLVFIGFFVLSGAIFMVVVPLVNISPFFLILVILSLVPFGISFYYLFSYMLVPSVIIIEGKILLGALRRSKELFDSGRDARWKIILIPYLMQILFLVISAIPYVGSIIVLLLTPLQVIAMTLVYFDIRIRYEGFDLELETEKIR
jgi:hypothetical protein